MYTKYKKNRKYSVHVRKRVLLASLFSWLSLSILIGSIPSVFHSLIKSYSKHNVVPSFYISLSVASLHSAEKTWHQLGHEEMSAVVPLPNSLLKSIENTESTMAQIKY